MLAHGWDRQPYRVEVGFLTRQRLGEQEPQPGHARLGVRHQERIVSAHAERPIANEPAP